MCDMSARKSEKLQNRRDLHKGICGVDQAAGGGLRWRIREFTQQMRKNQTADNVITAMAAHLTVLSFAGQNTGGMDIRERSGRKNNTMRDVLISIPTLAYKDWRIFFNFGDEDEEDRAVRNMRKEFPYRDDIEKVKR